MTDHKRFKARLVVALAGGALMASGCGESTPEAAKTTAQPDTVDYTRFLMRDGEQPGFRRVESVGTESFNAFVKSVTQAEARQLRRAGFISITFQPIEGPGTRGITNVQLFKTAKGARDTLAHEQRTDVIRGRLPGARIRLFTVPAIPGARGWTAAKDDHDVGNVHWVQGRCLLVLGNEGPGPLAGLLSAGARAIHQRTKGQCS